MATFQDVQGLLGYDIMSPMYKALIGGQGDPFHYANQESGGVGELYGAQQAAQMGAYDPSVFNPYTFDWQGTGQGKAGTLTAMKDGQSVGSWAQQDTPGWKTMLEGLAIAGAGFGGLGAIGHGPLANLFGGAAPAAEATTGGIGSMAGEGASVSMGEALGAGGAMSAGGMEAAGAAAGGSSLLGTIKDAGTGLIGWAKDNPRLAGAIVGGLAGGMGGGSSGGEAPYTGPMPTITRGGWQPNAQANLMQAPQFGGLLSKTGNANSGLWRYAK